MPCSKIEKNSYTEGRASTEVHRAHGVESSGIVGAVKVDAGDGRLLLSGVCCCPTCYGGIYLASHTTRLKLPASAKAHRAHGDKTELRFWKLV